MSFRSRLNARPNTGAGMDLPCVAPEEQFNLFGLILMQITRRTAFYDVEKGRIATFTQGAKHLNDVIEMKTPGVMDSSPKSRGLL